MTASQAGSTFACQCGRSVVVPTLSTLRKSAGESAIPLSSIERIEIMLRNGELPTGDICPVSGRPTDDTIQFHVQCEKMWVRGGSSFWQVLAYVLFFGWLGLLIHQEPEEVERFGRETSILIPLRISSEVRPKILRMKRQKKLKALLAQVPIYSQLLNDFPDATITPDDVG